MNIIRPTTITDALLTSSDVAETDYTEFSMGTTYAVGDIRMDSTGVEVITLDVAPATAWDVGDLITGQSSGKTAYVVAKLTTLTYQIRERSGAFTLGEVVGVTGTPAKLADQGAAHPTITAATTKVHRIYEAIAISTAKYPPTDLLLATPLYWKEVSATNRWKVFDNKVGAQASQATSMKWTLTPGAIDSIALLNLDATTVTIKLTDPGDGVVYNETIATVYSPAIIDGYTYCFEEFLYKTDIVKTDIPQYGSATLEITIASDSTAKCGEIVVGKKRDIGNMQYSPSLGITDFSTVEADDYGIYKIVERAFNKRMNIRLVINNFIVDEVARLLALYRATPIVVIGDEAYSCLIIYGMPKDFTIVIPYKNYSECNLEIRGLT
jgi:hypothetical protein